MILMLRSSYFVAIIGGESLPIRTARGAVAYRLLPSRDPTIAKKESLGTNLNARYDRAVKRSHCHAEVGNRRALNLESAMP